MSQAEQIQALAQPIVESYGCDIVQLTFRREAPGFVLRLLIEKKGSDPYISSGIDHKLCSTISRDLGTLLDAGDVIHQAFVLEVSSPGIERPLVCEADFERFTGRPVKVNTQQPISGKKRFSGRLKGIQSSAVTIETSAGDVQIPFGMITKANLIYEPSEIESRKTGES